MTVGLSDLAHDVRQLIFQHVRVPSLKHVQDGDAVFNLSVRITELFLSRRAIWRKWDPAREAVVKAAQNCWIPAEDLRQFVNDMPGPILTETDLHERLEAFREEDFSLGWPSSRLRESCEALYAKEREAGTELIAIIGAMRRHIEAEENRKHNEAVARYRENQEQDKRRRETMFLSGADCGWTPVAGSKEVYCRKNGRAYRTKQAADKTWLLHRVSSHEDQHGLMLGKYSKRSDLTKALETIAYQPDPMPR